LYGLVFPVFSVVYGGWLQNAERFDVIKSQPVPGARNFDVQRHPYGELFRRCSGNPCRDPSYSLGKIHQSKKEREVKLGLRKKLLRTTLL
jgi:hypothetical protein